MPPPGPQLALEWSLLATFLDLQDVLESTFGVVGSHSLWLVHSELTKIKQRNKFTVSHLLTSQMSSHCSLFNQLTNINKSSRCSFTKLFGFVAQRNFHHSRNVSRRRLNTNCVRCDQLYENKVLEQKQRVILQTVQLLFFRLFILSMIWIKDVWLTD